MREVNQTNDCMPRAVVSALMLSSNDSNKVYAARNIQSHDKRNQTTRIDPRIEAENLVELFKAVNIACTVEILQVNAISGIIHILNTLNRSQRLFLGYPQGQSSQSAHIVHIAERVDGIEANYGEYTYMTPGGFNSDQEFLPDETLRDQFMAQDSLPLFRATLR